MWPFRKSAKNSGPTPEQVSAVAEIVEGEHKGDLLDRCANDVERRTLCLQWAGAARNAYYEGRKQTIVDMLLSTDPRYKRMDARTRMVIGEMKWGKSQLSKELVGLEQMYSRWAVQYAGGPGSGR